VSEKSGKQPKYDMISIGDSTIDSYYKIHDAEVRAMKHELHPMLCISFADKIAVDAFDQFCAGNSANQAIGTSRLGLRAAIYTVVGDDPSGDKILQAFKDDDVDTEYVVVDKGHRSNSSAIISFQGERSILVYHEPHEYNLPDLAPSKWLYLSSLRLDLDKVHAQVVHYAKKHDVKIGYNPGTYQFQMGKEGMKNVLETTEMLFLNKEEGALLTGKPAFPIKDLMKALYELGPKTVLVTDGLDGAYGYDGKEFYFISIYPGPRVETTGAGDSFATAVIAATIHGEPFEQALRWGPINSASVVRQVGGERGLLHLDQMRKILHEHPEYQAEPLDDYLTRKRELERLQHKT
jgi:ribokinase